MSEKSTKKPRNTSKRPAGRPKNTQKLTKRKVDEFETLIKKGAWFNAACRAIGISESTGYNYLNKGKENRDAKESGEALPNARVYLDFLEAYEWADAMAGIEAAECLKEAATKDWRASIEFLKRRHRDAWSEHESDHGQQSITVNQLIVSIAQRVADRQKAAIEAGEDFVEGEGRDLPIADDDLDMPAEDW